MIQERVLDLTFRLLPVIELFLLLAGIAIAMTISITTGKASAYLPSISDIGSHEPQSLYLNSLCNLAAMCGFAVIIIRFISLANNCHVNRNLNRASLMIGLLSMIGLSLMVTFPISAFFIVHMTGECMFLFCGVVYASLSTALTHQVQNWSIKFFLRLYLNVVIIILGASLLLIYPLAITDWNKYNDISPALKKPTDQAFDMVVLLAVVEYLVFLLIISYQLTYYWESANLTICVVSERMSDVNGAVNSPSTNASVQNHQLERDTAQPHQPPYFNPVYPFLRFTIPRISLPLRAPAEMPPVEIEMTEFPLAEKDLPDPVPELLNDTDSDTDTDTQGYDYPETQRYALSNTKGHPLADTPL